jgi:hypothetical protein
LALSLLSAVDLVVDVGRHTAGQAEMLVALIGVNHKVSPVKHLQELPLMVRT